MNKRENPLDIPGKTVQNTTLIKRRPTPTRGAYIASSFVPIKMNLKLMFQHSEASRKGGRNTHSPGCRCSSGENSPSYLMVWEQCVQLRTFGGKYWGGKEKGTVEDTDFPWPFNIFTKG